MPMLYRRRYEFQIIYTIRVTDENKRKKKKIIFLLLLIRALLRLAAE